MIRLRASMTHLGHSESVSRGQPRRGLDFSHDLRSGLSLHFGVKEGLGRCRLTSWTPSNVTLAILVRPQSMALSARVPSPTRASPSGFRRPSGIANEEVSKASADSGA